MSSIPGSSFSTTGGRPELHRRSIHKDESSGRRLYPVLPSDEPEIEEDVEKENSGDDSAESMTMEERRRPRTRSQSPSRRNAGGSSPTSTGSDLKHRSHARSSPKETITATPRRPIADRSTEADSNIQHMVILAVVFVLAIVFMFFSYRSWNKPSDGDLLRTSAMVDIFLKELKDLTGRFPRQHSRLWSIVRSSVKNVMHRYVNGTGRGERSPAVILFINYDDSQATMACLMKTLANITSNAGRTSIIQGLDLDGSDFSMGHDANGATAKYALEKKLKDYFGKTGGTMPVVSLKNIHLLSSETALILHAYCDNENAPFPESVYYLSADCDVNDDRTIEGTQENVPVGRKPENDPEEWDELAEECLRGRWLNGGLNMDKLAPILSRIANNVVFVFPEPTLTISC